jgi:ribonuclease HI
MPYYVCSTGPLETDLSIVTSWPRAKTLTSGKSGGWSRRVETRAHAEAALEALRGRRGRKVSPGHVYVDGSAVLGEWSACAVFFGEGDARNAVRELPPPHTAPRAELQAVLLALERGAEDVVLWTDSAYVCQAFELGWTSRAHPELAARVRELSEQRNVVVRKVAGHAGIPGNEAVDAMLYERRRERKAGQSG